MKETIRLHDIDEIYNADETAINYEYVPDKTIDVKGTKNVWIKSSSHEKDRVSAMLLADSVGTKYPLFLVLKTPASIVKTTVIENLTHRNGFGVRLWKEIEELHERQPSRIFGNPSGWWNSQISIKFLQYHFGHRRNKNLKKILLMWDDFGAHFTSDVVAVAEELDTILEKIPPTFTWACQPADVAWMKPLKMALRKRWVQHLRDEIGRHKNGPFHLRCPDRFDIVDWVNEAWEGISKKVIINGFSKCRVVQSNSNIDEVAESQNVLQ